MLKDCDIALCRITEFNLTDNDITYILTNCEFNDYIDYIINSQEFNEIHMDILISKTGYFPKKLAEHRFLKERHINQTLFRNLAAGKSFAFYTTKIVKMLKSKMTEKNWLLFFDLLGEDIGNAAEILEEEQIILLSKNYPELLGKVFK